MTVQMIALGSDELSDEDKRQFLYRAYEYILGLRSKASPEQHDVGNPPVADTRHPLMTEMDKKNPE